MLLNFTSLPFQIAAAHCRWPTTGQRGASEKLPGILRIFVTERAIEGLVASRPWIAARTKGARAVMDCYQWIDIPCIHHPLLCGESEAPNALELPAVH